MSNFLKVLTSQIFLRLKMSNLVPKKEHLQEVLIHYFILKKSGAESYRIPREAYGEHAPSQDTCEC